MRKFVLLVVAILLLAGCLRPSVKEGGEQVEVLDVKPIVAYTALGGYTEDAKERFFVVAGGIETAWERATGVATGEAEQAAEFKVNQHLNLVVFRGVFRTGGYGLEIEKVERKGNSFYVHAVYANPGPGSMVTQAFTQPTAIIPIGPLGEGLYDAKLLVTVISKGESGETVLERGAEHASIEFKVM